MHSICCTCVQPFLGWVAPCWVQQKLGSLCSCPSPCGPPVPSERLGWVWPHPGLPQHLLLLTPGPLLTLLGITVPTSLLFRSLQASSVQVPLPYTLRRRVPDSPKTFPPALHYSQLSTEWACSFWSSELTHQGENTDASDSCDWCPLRALPLASWRRKNLPISHGEGGTSYLGPKDTLHPASRQRWDRGLWSWPLSEQTWRVPEVVTLW